MVMDLPFLKNKQKYAGGGVITERVGDSTSPDKMLDMVVDEFHDAFQKRDRATLLEALRAFIQLIKEQDEAQDAAE